MRSSPIHSSRLNSWISIQRRFQSSIVSRGSRPAAKLRYPPPKVVVRLPPRPVTPQPAGLMVAEWDDDEISRDAIIQMTPEIKMKNYLLATALFGFCVGVWWYSMHAVGQAADPNDPLATLREEAAVAQREIDRRERSASDQRKMLQDFQAGRFDLDVMEEDEPDNDDSSSRPWWRFW